jgi:hypothetical protein
VYVTDLLPHAAVHHATCCICEILFGPSSQPSLYHAQVTAASNTTFNRAFFYLSCGCIQVGKKESV